MTVTVTGVADSPTADAGGPYTVIEGGTVLLDASGSTDPDLPYGGTLTYAWDFDGDGVFDDATGVTPTFDAAGLSDGTVVDIAVEVTDSTNNTDIAVTTVTVQAASSELEFTSSGDPMNIGDNKTVSSPIDISGTGATVDTLRVRINLTHANPSDLSAQLISSTGSTLSIPGPILSGDYTHEYVTDGANGLPVDGTWTLQVTDSVKNRKRGSLIEWTMIVEPVPAGAAMAASTGESMSAACAPMTEATTNSPTQDATTVDTLLIEQNTAR